MAESRSRTYQTGKHLEAFILLLLKQRPDHGASLIDRLAAWLPTVWVIDPGRVYRILRSLEEEGAVTSAWEPGEAGPAVRVYRLTAAGEYRLAAWREEIARRRDSFDAFLRAYARLSRGGRAERQRGKGRLSGQDGQA